MDDFEFFYIYDSYDMTPFIHLVHQWMYSGRYDHKGEFL